MLSSSRVVMVLCSLARMAPTSAHHPILSKRWLIPLEQAMLLLAACSVIFQPFKPVGLAVTLLTISNAALSPGRFSGYTTGNILLLGVCLLGLCMMLPRAIMLS